MLCVSSPGRSWFSTTSFLLYLPVTSCCFISYVLPTNYTSPLAMLLLDLLCLSSISRVCIKVRKFTFLSMCQKTKTTNKQLYLSKHKCLSVVPRIFGREMFCFKRCFSESCFCYIAMQNGAHSKKSRFFVIYPDNLFQIKEARFDLRKVSRHHTKLQIKNT